LVASGSPRQRCDAGLSVVLADPSVPVAAKALAMAGIKLTPKSLQLDGAEVVEQVETGNAPPH
jgi:hypothetical protein